MKILGNLKFYYQWGTALCMCAPFILTACTNHLSEKEEYVNDGKIPFKFVADINAPANVRMQNNAFEEGDEVGVFASANSMTLKEERYMDNIRFKRSPEGEFCSAEPVYFPDDGSTLSFISYYPYQETGITAGESSMKVSVESEQNLAENYAHSDFLVATLKNQHATKETLSLSYKHKMFRLNIAIAPGEGENAEELCAANPQLSVDGFYTEAVYDFMEDSYSHHSEDNSILPTGTWEVQEGRLVGKSAILIPQGITAGYQYISLKVSGKTYRCTIPNNLNLQSGKQGELEITFVTVEDILVGKIKGEIEDWEEGDKAETDSEVMREYVNVATLDFGQSNVYKVISGRQQVAEICKEYIVAPEVSSQAIVAYPIKDGRADLTKGIVIQLIGQSGNVHGGQVSWDTENHSLTYTPGTDKLRNCVYVLADGQVTSTISIEDELLPLSPVADVLTDRRGATENQYPIVKIGTQYWLRDNLKTALYTDGTEIPHLDNIEENTTGYLLPESGNYFYTANVATSDILLPEGWRMPTWNDWNLLNTYIQEDASVLKAGTWKPIKDQPLEKATNMSGFNAQPVGMWWVDGKFADYEYKYVGYWTLDDTGNLAEKSCMLSSGSDEIRQGTAGNDRACSVRLLRK